MLQALLNRIKIFKVNISFFDKIKLFILSILLVFFRRLKIKLPDVSVKMLPQKNRVFIFDGTDLGTFLEIFLTHEYKIETLANFKRILDLGANTGYASIYFAEEFKQAEIVSVEPDLKSIKKIIKNTSDYNDRLTIEPSALSAKSGEITFFLNFDTTISGSTIMRDVKAKKMTVPSISLEDLEAKYGAFDLIKFDIEGGEWEALYPSMLKNPPKIWIGEYHTDLTKQPVEKFLERFGGYELSVRKLGTKRFIIIAQLK
jgi:FkbM family methyltransferase